MTSLSDFVEQSNEQSIPKKDELGLLHTIEGASAEIAALVNKAGLIDILGKAGAENVQGEEQQKLDVIADNLLVEAFDQSGIVCAVASEENESCIVFEDGPDKNYVVTFDPLDGSSNIDVNISIGTIFSIYKRKGGPAGENDFLRNGREQVLSGYVIYGTSTMLVFTSGNGSHAFTLNPDTKKFLLTSKDIRMPEMGKIYSINEGNYKAFSPGLKSYVEKCKALDNSGSKALSARYIGSMVADIHRNLLKGGVFIYPESESNPTGKLRLLYECHPMAFVVEQAGGLAHTGTEHILDLNTNELHQRCPVYMGSKNMVEDVVEMIAKTEAV